MSAHVPFHAMTSPDALRASASTVYGLSTAEANARLRGAATWLARPSRPTAALRVYGRQFLSPFIFVLGIAIAISWWSGHVLDVVVTAALVLTNTTLGFFQEFKADRAFFALQRYLPSLVTVRRDGVVHTIPAQNLVPGDIMVLRAGQNIVADGRIIEATHLSVSEAALSGESSPVEKNDALCAVDAGVFERRNMVYAGTSVMTGQGTVVVSAIGRQSEFGKIGAMTADVVSQSTPLEGEIRRLARFLTIVIFCIAMGMFFFATSRDVALTTALTLAVALAIAVIPEGLPVTLTVLLSAAMRRMLKRGVLIRHLSATETLGCVNVLCVDKTGTVTTGVMSVVEVRGITGVIGAGEGSKTRVALKAIAAQHQTAGNSAFAGAATAGAIARYVEGGGASGKAQGASGKVMCTASLPFDPAYRFSACRVSTGVTYVMGAPDAVIARLNDRQDRVAVQRIAEDMASRGLRVVALGACESAGELKPESITSVRFLACVGIEDPLRPSVPGAIALAERAGIRTIMMTGDHPETAKTIGAQAFDHRALTVMLGEEFVRGTPAERRRAVQEVNVFARMLPEHKLLVVQALHASGMRVAMTGDGVNDAPALKAADVGIAVDHATEVAKEASDLVLVDGDFGNIVHAVQEGRTVFTNARNVTVFLLSLSFMEVFSIVASFLFHLPLPLTPLMILWLNIITDGIPGMFFAFERADAAVMHAPPRDARDGILSSHVRSFFLVAGAGLLTAVATAFSVARAVGLDATELRSITYLSIGSTGLLFIFVTKSFRTSWRRNISTFSMLHIGALIGIVLLMLPFVVPMLRNTFGIAWPAWSTIGIVAVGIAILLAFLDIVKRRFVTS